ncbi:hypothetical protein BKI52_13585 [marine bacterium AO1-C]|nr:hypothetical protein BKI52_13585 [marine bacterium AO1-C]
MKRYTSNIIVFIAFVLYAQATLGSITQNTGGFVAHTIDSKYLKEQRKVFVKLPQGYQASGTVKYPVIYILGSRKLTRKTIQETDSMYRAHQMPKVIIVGIPHKSAQTRKRDLTPDFLKQNLKIEQAPLGQASQFLRFLEKEVITLINAQYATSTSRLLVGHSREGLCVMYILMRQSTLFTGYLALSPALWRENNLFVTKFEAFLQSTSSLSPFLFMSMGTREVTKMTQAFDKFVTLLHKYPHKEFTWSSSYTPNATHQTNHLHSVSQGILLFFKYQ